VPANPTLLAGLLRDGVESPDGTVLPGLQRALVAARRTLSPADYSVLTTAVTRLSRQARVPSTAFEAAAKALPVEPPPLPTNRGLSLATPEWVVRRDSERAVGTRMDLDEALTGVRERLARAGLVDPDDRVVHAGGIGVRVESPRFDEARDAARARFRLKVGLLVGLGVLIAVAVLMILVDLHRRRRYADLRSAMVAAVSHELRTPLSAIRTMAETLDKRLGSSELARDYPRRIVRESETLEAMVDNFLSYGRLERGQWTAHPESVRLADLGARLAAEAPEWTSRPVELDTAGLEGITVQADPELLWLAVRNLVHNAVHYGARTPTRVRLSAHAEPGATVITVTDNGPGIDPARAPRIFEEFERAPAGPALRRASGSGLGLALCRRVARAHGGEIHLAQTSAEGSTFELRLPA
jgi:signal transduction histidine kinase